MVATIYMVAMVLLVPWLVTLHLILWLPWLPWISKLQMFLWYYRCHGYQGYQCYWLLCVHKHARSAVCTFFSANYVGVLAEHTTKHCGSFTIHIKKNKYIGSYAEEVSVINVEA